MFGRLLQSVNGLRKTDFGRAFDFKNDNNNNNFINVSKGVAEEKSPLY